LNITNCHDAGYCLIYIKQRRKKQNHSKPKHNETASPVESTDVQMMGKVNNNNSEETREQPGSTEDATNISNTSELLHLIKDTMRICTFLSNDITADLANIENQFLQKLNRLERQVGIDSEVDKTENQHKAVVIKDSVELTYDKEEMFNSVIQVLQEESKWIKNRLANLESGVQKHFFQVLKNLFVQHQRTDKFITRQEDSIKQLDTAMTDVQLTVHNGIMILPIEDFQAKFQKAKVRDPASITSPAFYTRRGGYKLKIRVYLNGDGLGLGTHVSIYIMMCKSQFDAL
ncbi:unnamed protein product, partial [Owenia fusiformis]